ncbi:MAG: beta-glucosidase [Frankiaceae bacterium]|nr:beta-glucosidase [Frankiaceae bacterium]MDX6273383.1 beta-glucosidase [Frankiales bacterium]
MIGYGVATSAFQVEGGVDAHGRGPSTWDEFCTRPGAIKDGSDASIACDSYHRFDEDLELLVGLGVSAYRFSISWPRVQPTGSGPTNAAGLDYYDAIVDRLLANGIRPFPTLFHWDLPLALEEAGGWPARDTALRFAEYADLVVSRLGDRVGTWATMNEPWCTAFLGFAAGVFAPGIREPKLAFDAAHHLLLGHALAAEAMHARDAAHEVGIVLNLNTVRAEPEADAQAVAVVEAIQNGIWLDPLALGSYPDAVLVPRALHDGDLELIRGSADWVGINYYTPFRVGAPLADEAGVGQQAEAFPGAPPFSFRPRGPLTTMGWEIDPTGLEELIRDVSERMPGTPLRVTENGAAFADTTADDRDRIDYLSAHLAVVERLHADGLDLRDYFAWSLLDNFEWAEGYTQTFGLVAIEPGTLRRQPKASYRWYADYIAAHR